MWQGWSEDGAYVLLSDRWDVWMLPLHGAGRAMNLTGNGRRDEIVYLRTSFRQPEWGGPFTQPAVETETVDPGQPIYFTVRERRTGRMGIARRSLAAPELEDAARRRCTARVPKGSAGARISVDPANIE